MRKRNVHMPEGGEGRMKFGKMLLIALLCGLFLLLLSALVVAPETETVLPENLPLTGLEMSACALPVWADAGDSASRWFWMLAALFFCAPLCLLPRLTLSRDSNGCAGAVIWMKRIYCSGRMSPAADLPGFSFRSSGK